ncbi:BMP family ABC transporter substrate-binding protein [Aneurinibacillus sp. Ricciae_BoGa-3]|uniref:BMP family ABC transporter substrate-binding protein n=1 Tax=Aneurinibacillus sp. Ricciae_BoGa-3 TaxID=3022697 RepID=UPI00234035CB|nr:BMP family ABC transporter substrate-binding protein [Aneurinibacillus sp. Ricciae_BoGa-3]WCK56527.1 BMP family ABC transporter substrate-binding protein [Aneurinibacillus sp. Ricciae_BoGa-3]
MKKTTAIILLLTLLVGCSAFSDPSSPDPHTDNNTPTKMKVGLLLEGNIVDQTWESQAYKALRKIREQFNATVEFKEKVDTPQKKLIETERMAKQGFTLIIGNGRAFESSFNQLAPRYPSVKFVFFNGQPAGKNVTSYNFDPAHGYFTGMIAGLLTKTHKIGLIPGFANSKSISYFIKGAKDQDPRNEVYMEPVLSWDDKARAGKIADDMLKKGADILAPMGDGFNIEVTMRAWKAHAHVIGYISDSSFMARDTVLTSSLQNVYQIYLQIADDFAHNRLASGKFILNYKNGAESYAPFNPQVPAIVQEKVMRKISDYNNGRFKLPN